MKRRFFLLGIAALAPLALTGCEGAKATAEPAANVSTVLQVDVDTVRRGRVAATLDLVGTLLPVRGATIVSDVDGVIESLAVSDRKLQYIENGEQKTVALGLDIGNRVKEDEVLVQIDPTDFQLAVQIAEANLELAKANLADLKAWKRDEEVEGLQAAFDEASAATARAESELKRSQQLIDNRTVSQSAHDAAIMEAAMTRATLARARAALRLAQAGPTAEQIAVAAAQVKAAEAEVALRQEKLNKTTIRAPYDAIIADRFVGEGDRVTAMPRVEIMQIMDTRALFAQVAVPERYQGLIHLDDMAEVSYAGLKGSLPGRVELINARVDLETRTFRVRILIDNRQDLLRAGGFADVAVPIESAENAVLVPFHAVTFTEGLPAVFVLDGDRVKKTPVKLGISNSEVYEVISGVEPGQKIVVSRTALLADGLQVKPKQKQDTAPASPLEMQP